MNLRYIICDDELSARRRIRKLLDDIPGMVFVAEYKNGLELIKGVKNIDAEVAFVDIEMPILNGIEAAHLMIDNPIKIVFVTSHNEYAIQAFEAQSLDYILKPVREERLGKTVERIKKAMESRSLHKLTLPTLGMQKRIALKIGDQYQVIDCSEISVCSAIEKNVCVYFKESEVFVDDTLDHLEKKLSGLDFFRCHRSHIINLNFLEKLHKMGDQGKNYYAKLCDYFETSVPVSRRSLPTLKEKLKL